jgi:hypothetical protein
MTKMSHYLGTVLGQSETGGAEWRLVQVAESLLWLVPFVPKSQQAIPPRLRISPTTLTCPYCKAKRGNDCGHASRGLTALHSERIEMAALADKIGALRTRAEKRRRTNGAR